MDDRRVQRTKQLLRTALFSLIQEKGFEGLTVQEILDRANVGRATFYAHFESKEDLLLSGLETLQKSLRERQRAALTRGKTTEDRMLAFTLDLFAHAAEHRVLFRAMAGQQSGAAVRRVLYKMLLDLVREEARRLIPHASQGAVAPDAFAHFLAGSLFGLLMWWMETKMQMSAEEVNALFRRMAIPAMKAASQ